MVARPGKLSIPRRLLKVGTGVKRAIAILFLLIAAGFTASAQNYSVRVVHRTYLRATHSLEARIVDTAMAGTTLSVTGNQGDWLRIDWKGREVWMADWVALERVETPPPTITSDVNNCCFIDRQCASDAEWVDGYWAFQSNQCGAPTTPLTTVATETSIPASEVTNCCQLGWTCNSDGDWQTGHQAFQAGQCQHQGIEIEGPAFFLDRLHSVLDLIRSRSPHWYGYIIGGLSKVRYDPNARRSAVDLWAQTWHVPPSRVERWGDDVSIVGSLTHEACHVQIYLAGQKAWDLQGERDCLAAQLAAAQDIFPGEKQYYIDWASNLLANIENPAYQWWHD